MKCLWMIWKTLFLMQPDNARPSFLHKKIKCMFSDADQLMATIEVISMSLNICMVRCLALVSSSSKLCWLRVAKQLSDKWN